VTVNSWECGVVLGSSSKAGVINTTSTPSAANNATADFGKRPKSNTATIPSCLMRRMIPENRERRKCRFNPKAICDPNRYLSKFVPASYTKKRPHFWGLIAIRGRFGRESQERRCKVPPRQPEQLTENCREQKKVKVISSGLFVAL
jgi:hypothetical protein